MCYFRFQVKEMLDEHVSIILTYAFNRNIRALHLSKYDAGTTLTFYPVVAVKVHVLNSYINYSSHYG